MPPCPAVSYAYGDYWTTERVRKLSLTVNERPWVRKSGCQTHCMDLILVDASPAARTAGGRRRLGLW